MEHGVGTHKHVHHNANNSNQTLNKTTDLFCQPADYGSYSNC